ncbi:MAG: IS1595 family transposase [Dehalococcoidia bacterium]|nr:IS1595 family transposase [Dehalococcoidia bacterium]
MDKYTTKDFDNEFSDDISCLGWIKNYLWPDGIYCPECEKITKHHHVTGRQCYACDYCGHQVHPLANTIFRKSATPLRIWFQVIYRMASTRCGISAKQIQRETGVTYKTAWRMFKQIRTLMDENFKHLTGEVEVDETYVGGVRRGKRGRGADGKTKVLGAVQRNGKVVAKVVPDVKRHTLVPFMANQVDRNAILYTDEFPSYDHMARLGYKHLRICHHAKEYVRGKVHTNSIEGFWSLVKRGIDGVYHSVSPQYLQSYINEYSFRYNHRQDETPMFKIVLNRI